MGFAEKGEEYIRRLESTNFKNPNIIGALKTKINDPLEPRNTDGSLQYPDQIAPGTFLHFLSELQKNLKYLGFDQPHERQNIITFFIKLRTDIENGVAIDGARLKRALDLGLHHFKGINLSGVTVGSRLEGVDMRNAVIRNSQINAGIHTSNLRGSKIEEGTTIRGSIDHTPIGSVNDVTIEGNLIGSSIKSVQNLTAKKIQNCVIKAGKNITATKIINNRTGTLNNVKCDLLKGNATTGNLQNITATENIEGNTVTPVQRGDVLMGGFINRATAKNIQGNATRGIKQSTADKITGNTGVEEVSGCKAEEISGHTGKKLVIKGNTTKKISNNQCHTISNNFAQEMSDNVALRISGNVVLEKYLEIAKKAKELDEPFLEFLHNLLLANGTVAFVDKKALIDMLKDVDKNREALEKLSNMDNVIRFIFDFALIAINMSMKNAISRAEFIEEEEIKCVVRLSELEEEISSLKKEIEKTEEDSAEYQELTGLITKKTQEEGGVKGLIYETLPKKKANNETAQARLQGELDEIKILSDLFKKPDLLSMPDIAEWLKKSNYMPSAIMIVDKIPDDKDLYDIDEIREQILGIDAEGEKIDPETKLGNFKGNKAIEIQRNVLGDVGNVKARSIKENIVTGSFQNIHAQKIDSNVVPEIRDCIASLFTNNRHLDFALSDLRPEDISGNKTVDGKDDDVLNIIVPGYSEMTPEEKAYLLEQFNS